MLKVLFCVPLSAKYRACRLLLDRSVVLTAQSEEICLLRAMSLSSLDGLAMESSSARHNNPEMVERWKRANFLRPGETRLAFGTFFVFVN